MYLYFFFIKYFLGLKMNSIGGILGATFAIVQEIKSTPPINNSIVTKRCPPISSFFKICQMPFIINGFNI